jgi:cephalosporin hydroxylase
MNSKERAIVRDFHNLYYNGVDGEGHIYGRTYWMGVQCLKCPLDLWIYQEIFAELRPDLIVETGTRYGGSAFFMAHMLDLLGKGEIITIDIEELPRPDHPRIKYVTGSSADPELIQTALAERPDDEVRVVILDSDHTKSHVWQEMNLLAPYVSVGGYLIVEDTNILTDGPLQAVEAFLQTNTDFVVDAAREKFLLTFNPRGYLRRIR